MASFRIRLAIPFVAMAMMSACATPQFGGSSQVAVVEGGALPEPDPSVAYALGPLDKVSVSVFGAPELAQTEVQIDAAGNLLFPFVGALPVAGRTTEQVAAAIQAELRGKIVRDPKVTVNVIDTVSKTITVEGEVREPGIYGAGGTLTLLRAVARAKGMINLSSLEDVVVFRTVGGQRYAALYNIAAIRRGAYVDPNLFPDDVVVVGKSRARQLFEDIISILPAAVTPIVLAIN